MVTPSPAAPAFRTYGEVEILRGRIAALQTEVERLTGALQHIKEVARAAAFGREVVSHWWYQDVAHRALDAEPRPVAESDPVSLSRTDSTTVRVVDNDGTPAVCYRCGQPAVAFINTSVNMASSVPSHMEPVCGEHDPYKAGPAASRGAG